MNRAFKELGVRVENLLLKIAIKHVNQDTVLTQVLNAFACNSRIVILNTNVDFGDPSAHDVLCTTFLRLIPIHARLKRREQDASIKPLAEALAFKEDKLSVVSPAKLSSCGSLDCSAGAKQDGSDQRTRRAIQTILRHRLSHDLDRQLHELLRIEVLFRCHSYTSEICAFADGIIVIALLLIIMTIIPSP